MLDIDFARKKDKPTLRSQGPKGSIHSIQIKQKF